MDVSGVYYLRCLLQCFVCSYTAVGVFVLSRMFREAWGTKALNKEAEFNDFLEVIPWTIKNFKCSRLNQLPEQGYLIICLSFPRKIACVYLWNW